MLGQMSLLRDHSRRRGTRLGRSSGLTLIELMVVVAVIGIIALVAAPSFRDMLELRRLKGVSTQFLTDVQFARSEAASRQELTGITFPATTGPAAGSCYIIQSCGTAVAEDCRCDCTAAPGARCVAPMREIKTVSFSPGLGVKLAPEITLPAIITLELIAFEPATGRLSTVYWGYIGGARTLATDEFLGLAQLTRTGATAKLRTEISVAGRPRNCSPGGVVSGVNSC